MCWLGCIPPRREEGPALGVSTPQVCIRVVPGKRELLLLLLFLSHFGSKSLAELAALTPTELKLGGSNS